MSRSGVAANPNMDNLSYKYDYYNNNPAEGLRNNRLYHVNDGISSTGYDDVQDQGTFVPESPTNDVNLLNNYGYDELGNLVRDNQEEIAAIEWTVSGKIKSVTRTGGSILPNLEFVYDPMGNRIAKIETPNPYDPNGVKTTFYARDAQGNHLVTYDHHWNPSTSNEHFLLDERIIYGSKRLGIQDFNDSIWGSEDVPPVADYYERNLGRKKYEGTNHLGNVLAVYSDKKLPKDDITPGGAIDYYEADIHGAYDYYSFGSPMPDRTFVPEACSTQTLVINNYTYQDNFPNPVPLWNPVGGAAIGWAGPGAMTVNCNVPNEGVQQVLPCVPGVQNTLDLTITFGNNPISITLLDPLTMMPLPGYPILYPSPGAGTIFNIQLFFIGPPSSNVLVQITIPGGPFPDMFTVNYAAISTQTTLQQQVCWDEDYRFGFNGQEKDNEIIGVGNSVSFEYRILDLRLGRFLSIDKLAFSTPWKSPFVFASNIPITLVDVKGLADGNPNDAASAGDANSGGQSNSTGGTPKDPIPIPQGGRLVPQSDANNKQVGTAELVKQVREIIEKVSDNDYEDLKTDEGTHAAANTALNTNVNNAFSGVTEVFQGELDDFFDDDDITIKFEIEIVSIDEEIAPPVLAATSTNTTGTNASSTSSTTSSAGASVGASTGPQGTTGTASVNGSVSNTNSTTAGATAQQSTTTTQGVYKVTYRVKITVMYDRDSYLLSGSTGTTKSYYSSNSSGVLYSPTPLTVTAPKKP